MTRFVFAFDDYILNAYKLTFNNDMVSVITRSNVTKNFEINFEIFENCN